MRFRTVSFTLLVWIGLGDGVLRWGAANDLSPRNRQSRTKSSAGYGHSEASARQSTKFNGRTRIVKKREFKAAIGRPMDSA